MKISTNGAKIHNNLGLMYGGKGFFSLAADHLYKAGVLFLQQGDGKGAIKSFEGLNKPNQRNLNKPYLRNCTLSKITV